MIEKTVKTLQIIASLPINAKKELLNIFFMRFYVLQDKKITQKAFLVVGL